MIPFTLGIICFLLSPQEAGGGEDKPDVTPVKSATEFAGLQFTDKELAELLPWAQENIKGFQALRNVPIENSLAPATLFSPHRPVSPVRTISNFSLDDLPSVQRPQDLKDLYWAEIPTLSSLIKTGQVSCVELTQLFLTRLREIDQQLHCVISFTEKRALAQAALLDADIAQGKYRGPLHGIPYGVKDLCSVKGTKTTWGAMPFKDQVLDQDATVVKRLDEAGAILIAKLTLGALAMGDIWYGGKTLSPWNTDFGSSGSSAGSAAAVGAGAIPFAIGSETLGSIVSPSTRCGNSSLRPTFGRVSKHGAMALSWSMDKLGPICRSLKDTAFVFSSIHGSDPKDLSAVDEHFDIPADVSVDGWKVGYSAKLFEKYPDHATVLTELKSIGVELIDTDLPAYPLWPLMIILFAESAAAFDDFTRNNLDDELVEQGSQAWPNTFRVARLIPAVDYIRAQRIRSLLMRDMNSIFGGLDAYVAPADDFTSLGITNLTGHPALVAPCGFEQNNMPRSITLTGHIYGESQLIALGRAWQEQSKYHLQRPPLKPVTDTGK